MRQAATRSTVSGYVQSPRQARDTLAAGTLRLILYVIDESIPYYFSLPPYTVYGTDYAAAFQQYSWDNQYGGVRWGVALAHNLNEDGEWERFKPPNTADPAWITVARTSRVPALGQLQSTILSLIPEGETPQALTVARATNGEDTETIAEIVARVAELGPWWSGLYPSAPFRSLADEDYPVNRQRWAYVLQRIMEQRA